MYSNGDARSAISQHARDSSSMPPDHTSSALWERPGFTRDKFERPERDKYASAKKDWALDNRPSSTRSSNALFSNASYAGPPAKRKALGRHGPIYENSRYGSAAGRLSDLAVHSWSPSENGKADRDFYGGPSPGYSSSPSTEKSSKDPDGHQFRDSNLSPGETRPAASPRFDPTSRLNGNQTSLDGTAPRERERSKFSSSSQIWDASHRERDYRERVWCRPDYHRRTLSLPKLDSPRDWNGGDRELLEGRLDRYGSASSRDPAISDVLNTTSKEHYRYDWRNRDRNLFSGFSSFPSSAPSTNNHIMDNGAASARPEVPRVSPPPGPVASQRFASRESGHEDAGAGSSKKRPRLTWGQGLAKYEKEKVEDDPSATKKSKDSDCGMEELCEGVHTSVPKHHQCLQNGDVSPCHKHSSELEERAGDPGGNQGMQVEMLSQSVQGSAVACVNLESAVQEAPLDDHFKDSRLGVPLNPSEGLVQDAALVPTASESSVLHGALVFLESVHRERPTLSKDYLTHLVEKLELEIERCEKELMRVDSELCTHEPSLLKTDEGSLQKQIVSMHDVADANLLLTGAKGSVSFDGNTAIQLQHSDCVGITPSLNSCAESLPMPLHDASVHVQEVQAQESSKELQVRGPGQKIASEFKAPDQVVDDTEGVIEKVMVSAGRPGELLGQGGHLGFEQRDAGLPVSIIFSNQCIAEQTSKSLSHLNSPAMENVFARGRLYASPQEATIWKLNAESHARKRKYIESKIIEEKGFQRFTEVALAVKWRAQKEAWKQKQCGGHSKVDTEKDPTVLWRDQADHSNFASQQSPFDGGFDTGTLTIGGKIEEVKAVEKFKCFSVEKEREFLRMPLMHLGKKRRDDKFETQNGLVKDPVSAEQERKAFNPWSREEKKIFLDKYFLLGKNFRGIAAYLDHKTVADCVEFYYRNQKTEEFEKVHSRHQLMKQRDYQPSVPYLATTTLFSSRHREGNAASLEGLTLVAAAAAALSVPKKLSNVSLRAGSAAGGFTKPFPRALATEGSNEERRAGKGARSLHTRPKTVNEESDQQWSDNEKKAFENAVVMFGKNFYSISQHIGTKTERQCKAFFSKARKGLGLDQLVERHNVILQASTTENEMTTPLIRDMKGNPASSAEGSPSQEQCMLKKSSPPVVAPYACTKSHDTFELPENKCQHPDAMSICASNSTYEGGQGHNNLPERSLSEGVRCVNTVIKEEACTLSDSGVRRVGDGDIGTGIAANCQVNGASFVEPLQGCSLEEKLACGEILQLKSESLSLKVESALAGNSGNVVCNGTLSHIHTMSPPLVSALVPTSLPLSPLIQSAQVKETKARREPTSWTQEEKDKFVDVLKVYGKNWDRLRENLPGKSLTQIKTYFQNSKAKLGFGVENATGRGGSSRKKKADDSDSSSNAGSGGQNAPQMVPTMFADDVNLKVSPSMLVPPGGVGSHGLAAEALVYSNLFSRSSLEDSVGAQKVFHSLGLTNNTSTASIHPLLNSTVFASPNLRVSQQPFVHTNVAKAQQAVGLQQPPQQAASQFGVNSPLQQPIVSLGIHQLQQPSPPQPVSRMLQELALPAMQQLHKQPTLLQSEVNQQVLFQQQQQQQQQQVVQQLQQQVTEAVLQQQLAPPLLQRQQQMLASGVPHHNFQQVLSQHQAHLNTQAPNQLPLGSSQSACSQTASVSQPITSNQQLQQQSDLFQSQLYQFHAKSPALLPPHQQTQQLQLLQLHWQQQQAQAQLVQAKQAQNQLSNLQSSNFALLHEQQQPLAVFRGIVQATNACTEPIKQSDLDYSSFVKSHPSFGEDLHRPSVVSQAIQTPISNQVGLDHARAGDVKLFGQSLLSQPCSSTQHSGGAVTSSSPQGSFSAPSSGFIAGKSLANTALQPPPDALIRGPGWQTAWPAAHFVRNGSSIVLATGNTSVGPKGADLEHHKVHEAVMGMNERFIRESMCQEEGGSKEDLAKGISNVLVDRANQHSEFKRPENVMGFDYGIPVNKCGEQESSQTPALAGGQQSASQGLPRVLDALVALAEWRLQNVNGGSGRLTDEFLSQSWEALQRDPGSLVEASKAGGSLAQMCTGGREMLLHLKDNLSNGGVMRAGSSGQLHLSDAQNMVAQSPSLLLQSGEAEILKVRDSDGRGGGAAG